ncbi:TonB-dependent siderophore receptor [Stutzerimonas kirkiae]|uniref:TonB-dependent siderophore receptor n=1 Tax=Stutzerimonas kirkiae TaxID=2211392 RepID=A0A4Q9REF8_9GAMM|nr:TonB-dependent receptor [Stutzerimonas kirkiae]TBU99199.1 TonB-dependent siderophore receptor [Stutzerimonas kirkiae]TBV06341.1 TonB-dependent siderophore receptor [Stutzerimonas kirkiae]TBV15768.1 TonB-dependent siderophore receptor [Stutzerimonas kirkiae]
MTRQHHSLARQVRQVLLLGLLSAPLAGLPGVAQAAGEAASYSIQAGSLSQALTRFAAEAGITLQFSPDLTEGLVSPGLSGGFSVEQGLAQLLANTRLQAVGQGNGVYVLVLVSEQEQGEEGIQLPDLAVSARRTQSATTERSGSYGSSTGTTALPFNASLRDTPQSVSVITRQMLDDKKIDNLIDVVEHTPGLSISRYESNRGSMFSRGFKIENYLIDGVPTTIDEQWSAGEILNGTSIYDRVEVLRGSDGLMTGVGNPSAVINMVRKRADSKELKGSVSAEGGSWSHYGASLDVSAPLSPSGGTRGRLVLDHDQEDSHVDYLESRKDVFYGTLEQDIGDRTLLSAGFSHQKDDTNGPTWGGLPAWTMNGDYSQVVALKTKRSQGVSPDWTYWDSDYSNWFVEAEHRFNDNWNARARYSRGERESEAKIAMLYSYPLDSETGKSGLFYTLFPGYVYKLYMPGYAGIYYVENIKNDVNLQFDGTFQLLGRNHEAAFGYDRSKERFTADSRPGSISADDIPGFRDFAGHVAEPDYWFRRNNKKHEITQEAFYAASRIELADPLKLIVGGRLIDYQVDDIKTSANSFESNNEVVPYAGLVLNLNRQLSAYASYTSIFQPQNYRDIDNKLLAPIEGNTYEAGLKGMFFDDRLSASLSVYRMEQDNVAQSIGQAPDDPTRQAYKSIDGVVSKGYEAEIAGEVTENWQVYAGYSQFKARDANGNDVNSLIPRRQLTMFTSYRLPGALNALTVGGGVRWQSKVWVHQPVAKTLGVPRLEQESYAIVDLMARYQVDANWSAQLNIKNALDKKYFAPTEDGLQLYWQEPRNAELSVKYQF